MARGLTRGTLKHAGVYGSAAVASKAVGFLMLPVYAHLFRDSGYGQIAMVDTSLSLVLSLLANGVGGAMMRYYHAETGDRRKSVVPTGIVLVAVPALAIATLAMIFSKPLSQLLLGDAASYPLICLGFGTFFFDLTANTASSILLIQRRSVVYSLIGLAQLLVSIGLNIWLLLVLKLGLLGYFLTNFVVAICAALTFGWFCVRECGFPLRKDVARELLQYQWPLVPGALVAWVAGQIESLIVRFSISLGGVGRMQMGMKFPSLITLLIAEPFMRSWVTKQFELAEADPDAARIQSGRMFTTYMFFLLFASLVVAACVDSVLRVFTPSEFWWSSRIARIQIVTVILGACYSYLNFGLMYAKATHILAVQRGVSACGKTLLSLLFVGMWGMDGVALAGCISAALLLVFGTRRSQKFFRQRLEYRRVATLIFIAVAMYLLIGHGPVQSLPGIKSLERFVSVQVVDFLKSTALADWNSGQIVQAVATRSMDATLLLVKLGLCLTFGFTAPLAHPEMLRGLRRRLGR